MNVLLIVGVSLNYSTQRQANWVTISSDALPRVPTAPLDL